MVGKNFCELRPSGHVWISFAKVQVVPTVSLFWSVGKVFSLRIINLKKIGLLDSQKFPPIQHFRVYIASPYLIIQTSYRILSQCLFVMNISTKLYAFVYFFFLISLYDCFKYLSSRQCVQWLMYYDEINWYVLVISKHVYIWCRLLTLY